MAKDKVFTLDFFRRKGKLGGKVGGRKAAANMTPQQRTERAKKAVAARKWNPLLTEDERAARARAKAEGVSDKIGRQTKVIKPLETKRPVRRKPGKK